MIGRPPEVTEPWPLIDIGLNLMGEAFADDREDMLDRAVEHGVVGTVAIASDLAEAEASLAFANERPRRMRVVATAGVHPHRAGAVEDLDAMAERLRELAHGAAAIGECGLDYFRNYSPRPAQQRVFEQQVEVACELGIPLYVHDRDAHEDVAAVLENAGSQLPACVVHCFTGTDAALERWLKLGVYIGVTGWICDERRGARLCQQVANIPHDRLLLETDAPYLMPRSIRPRPKTRRNEPALLPWVLEAVARHRAETPTEVAAMTTINAQRLFAGLGPSEQA